MPNTHKHPSVSIHYLNIINNALERIGFQSPEINTLTEQYIPSKSIILTAFP
jgi:hypothetical protein